MSLKHALLGFLRRKPQTGYALKTEQFDKSVAYFWPADQTQIYKTLDKMVEDGLATSKIEVQLDRPNRKIYSITAQGSRELEQWLCEPGKPPVDRDPLLVQLFFSEFIDADDMLSVLKSAKSEYQAQLKQLRSIDIAPVAKCGEGRELAARLTLELGLKSKQAYLDWLDQAIDAISSRQRKSKKSGRAK